MDETKPSPAVNILRSPFPFDLCAEAVRANAHRILDAADTLTDDAEIITLHVHDAFLEPADADALADMLAPIGCSALGERLHRFVSESAAVRLVMLCSGPSTRDDFAILVSYASPQDVPESPASFTWIEPDLDAAEMQVAVLCETFPSLRGAPGVRPFNAEVLAAWARGDGHAAQGSAALVIGLVTGLDHSGTSHVARLVEALPGRLSWFMREVFDAAHREAAERALSRMRAGRLEFDMEVDVEPVVTMPRESPAPVRALPVRRHHKSAPAAVQIAA